ncbi:unnamed protein product [Spirodela intermedia]|uniref:Uncharacterized protein n=1 Tax=Spirodela intermedia TaxID=51605 RepID=A0A7I8K685_SPIIN|nr:unnamed protein product [Spirodela intermedia]
MFLWFPWLFFIFFLFTCTRSGSLCCSLVLC